MQRTTETNCPHCNAPGLVKSLDGPDDPHGQIRATLTLACPSCHRSAQCRASLLAGIDWLDNGDPLDHPERFTGDIFNR